MNDPRPFAAVLSEWMERNGFSSHYAAAKRLGLSHHSVIGRWLDGGAVSREIAERALLDATDTPRQ